MHGYAERPHASSRRHSLPSNVHLQTRRSSNQHGSYYDGSQRMSDGRGELLRPAAVDSRVQYFSASCDIPYHDGYPSPGYNNNEVPHRYRRCSLDQGVNSKDQQYTSRMVVTSSRHDDGDKGWRRKEDQRYPRPGNSSYHRNEVRYEVEDTSARKTTPVKSRSSERVHKEIKQFVPGSTKLGIRSNSLFSQSLHPLDECPQYSGVNARYANHPVIPRGYKQPHDVHFYDAAHGQTEYNATKLLGNDHIKSNGVHVRTTRPHVRMSYRPSRHSGSWPYMTVTTHRHHLSDARAHTKSSHDTVEGSNLQAARYGEGEISKSSQHHHRDDNNRVDLSGIVADSARDPDDQVHHHLPAVFVDHSGSRQPLDVRRSSLRRVPPDLQLACDHGKTLQGKNV